MSSRTADRQPRRRPRRLAVLPLLLAGTAAWAWRSDFEGRWVEADATLRLQAVPAEVPRGRRLRFFAGHQDVSALARISAIDGRIELEAGPARWLPGEYELIVYDAESWAELARMPLKVLTRGGFEKSRWTPKLDLQLDGRPAARRSDGQPVAGRGTYEDATGRAGLAWSGARDGWQFEATANAAGASARDKALRFAQLGARAPQVDLADYRLAAAWGEDHRFEAGHLAGRSHPLLAQDTARRGIAWHGRLGAAADASVHLLRTTVTVGWDHLLGVEEAEQRSKLLSLGVELLPERAGALRAEVGLLDAVSPSRLGFDGGRIPDAERSRGLSLRLAGGTEDGRWQGELAAARSRFVNPPDPQLAQGGESTPVLPATRNAWIAGVQWLAFRTATPSDGAPPPAWPLELRLSARHEQAAPLYRSLFAPVQADQSLSRVGLQATLRGASASLSLARRLDNLDRVPTLLRSRTDESNAALSLPLPTWLDEGRAASWWPSLAWSWQRVHQFAANLPRPEDSGFAASQRPDQLNRVQTWQLGWTRELSSLGYTLETTLQDNRQSGRELADVRTLAHRISWSHGFDATLRANFGLQRQRRTQLENHLVQWSDGASVGIEWNPDERWAFAAGANGAWVHDSQQVARTRNLAWQAQASRRFALPGIDKPLAAQWVLRLARQSDRADDRAFGLASGQRSWWLDLGFSAGFF